LVQSTRTPARYRTHNSAIYLSRPTQNWSSRATIPANPRPKLMVLCDRRDSGSDWDQSMMVRRSTTLIREFAADFLAGLLIILVVFVLAALESSAARSEPVRLAAAPDSSVVVSSHAAGTHKTPLVLDRSPAAPEAAQTELRVAVGPNQTKVMPLQAAPRNWLFAITIMTLFFAAMCAVTLGFWRHIRREYASPRRK